jgi:hypothetical protein
MRKYLIVFATAALVITAGATSKLVFFPAPVHAKTAVTTLEPMTMHYGTMPVQEMTDRTFIFTE